MRVAWFSAGITSAVATKLALEKYKDVHIFYIGISSAHPDNDRFISECESWFGQEIIEVRNVKGYEDQFNVIEKTGYVNGAYGARCTLELKKEVRYCIEKEYNPSAQIFGFEYSTKEINRAIRFKEQYPNTKPLFPLIEAKLNKEECHGIMQMAGIEPPEMYKLGYNNNNCIGCVKGKKGYWNKIRQDFPDVFNRMAVLERKVGHSCIKEDLPKGGSKPVFLDELKPNTGRIPTAVVPDCGMFCQVEFAHIIDPRVKDLMKEVEPVV
jgi:3'-phosphoadenosine 5'-phosphosulfate sulfotransferase (PAPS reductase)/FAD synthetase